MVSSTTDNADGDTPEGPKPKRPRRMKAVPMAVPAVGPFTPRAETAVEHTPTATMLQLQLGIRIEKTESASARIDELES